MSVDDSDSCVVGSGTVSGIRHEKRVHDEYTRYEIRLKSYAESSTEKKNINNASKVRFQV